MRSVVLLALLTLPCAWSLRRRPSKAWPVLASREGSDDSDECPLTPYTRLPFAFPAGEDWRRNCVKPMCGPRDDVDRNWIAFPLKDVDLLKRPKLAVMVMATSNMTLPQVWQSWLGHAKLSGLPFRFMIHATSISQPFQNAEFRKHVLNRSAEPPTRWCKVADAEWLLMREALADPEVTHLAMVSGDSIPLKSLRYMLEDLAKQPKTRMCMDWTHGQRAETWFVMHRADAELFVEHQSFVDRFFRPVHMCEEERMWMYPLVMRAWRHGPVKAPLVDDCVMWTDWGYRCQEWASHVLMSNFSAVRREQHRGASIAHPRTYFRLSDEGIGQLQQSQFWWARKFSEDSLNPSAVFDWDAPRR